MTYKNVNNNNNNKAMSSLMDARGSTVGWVKFNVGGKVFQTTVQSFKTTEPTSDWARLGVENPPNVFTLDCDPEVFTALLYYFKTGDLHVDQQRIRIDALMNFAERCHMERLMQKLKDLKQSNRADIVRVSTMGEQTVKISASKAGKDHALIRKLLSTFPDYAKLHQPTGLLTVDLGKKDAATYAILVNDCSATLGLLGYVPNYMKVNAAGGDYEYVMRTS
ncbi:hypothetical protein AAVH_01179 [Aphelenchoides avenae]|nr:hypothetical protein AAVH_01179 [Aphelenchus avenae]